VADGLMVGGWMVTSLRGEPVEEMPVPTKSHVHA
jgi:hypothetical protein